MKEKECVQRVRSRGKAVPRAVCFLFTAIVCSIFLYSASAKAANPILTYKDEAIYRVGDSLRDKQNNYLLKKGQSAVFTATQSHYNNLLSIRWSVNRSGILSITRTGGKSAEVRGVGAGVATLDGTIESYYFLPGGGYDLRYMSNPFPVRVVEPLRQITLEKTQINLVKGQKDKVVVSTMIPDSLYSLVFSTPLTYSSSNPSVVTVDSSGYIQGQADGTALVTVSTVDGVTAVCSVKVSSGQASKPSDTSKPTKPDGKPSNERITVKATKIRSITNLKGKKLRVVLKKSKGASGYEVAYSTDKKFKKNVKKMTTKKTACTIKNKVKKNRVYYVRARAYKFNASGKKVYGSWSAKKSIRIRK